MNLKPEVRRERQSTICTRFTMPRTERGMPAWVMAARRGLRRGRELCNMRLRHARRPLVFHDDRLGSEISHILTWGVGSKRGRVGGRTRHGCHSSGARRARQRWSGADAGRTHGRCGCVVARTKASLRACCTAQGSHRRSLCICSAALPRSPSNPFTEMASGEMIAFCCDISCDNGDL
jgi:hypothetical protein